MRIPQKKGTKGSLKWIQFLINHYPAILNNEINKQYGTSPSCIEWLSPLESDEFAEYKDGAFLELLGLSEYEDDLTKFWPNMGAQWDALGRFPNKGPYILLEAKANIREVISSCMAESDASIKLIRESLNKTQSFLGYSSYIDWMKGFYQYANRMAHLYFLRERCGVDARMVFLYFLNDKSHIPTSKAEWSGALEMQKMIMGLNKHKLQKYSSEIFIDVNEIGYEKRQVI